MQTKPKRYGKQAINTRQIKLIHAIKGKLGISDDDYRTLLYGLFEVLSSKALSWAEAEDLITELNGKAGNPPQPSCHKAGKHAETKKYSNWTAGPAWPPERSAA